MKRLLPMVGFVCFVTTGSAQEIARYMPKPPFSTAMESAKKQMEREAAAKEEAMATIETLGLYAVAARSVKVTANDGTPVNIGMGDAFPFLGFEGQWARIKLAGTWMQVPRNGVRLAKLADEPALAADYQQTVAAYVAFRTQSSTQRSLDESNAQLTQIQRQQQQAAFEAQQAQDEMIRQQQRLLQQQQDLERKLRRNGIR